jgi:hypothetical protein
MLCCLSISQEAPSHSERGEVVSGVDKGKGARVGEIVISMYVVGKPAGKSVGIVGMVWYNTIPLSLSYLL